jgi:hypothetical protein
MKVLIFTEILTIIAIYEVITEDFADQCASAEVIGFDRCLRKSTWATPNILFGNQCSTRLGNAFCGFAFPSRFRPPNAPNHLPFLKPGEKRHSGEDNTNNNGLIYQQVLSSPYNAKA